MAHVLSCSYQDEYVYQDNTFRQVDRVVFKDVPVEVEKIHVREVPVPYEKIVYKDVQVMFHRI